MDDPRLCDLHGINRRDCVECLRQWVDDLLETQTWHHRAHRDLVRETQRLRQLLAENGIEEPPFRVSPMLDRPRTEPPNE